MSPFFDQPGSQAGPYSTPAQPGILSRILQGVNVAMKIGDFYQDWKTKSQAQETGALQQFASKLGIQKALAGEDQSTDMSTLGPEAEGLGFKVPRVTPESQVGMAGTIMQNTAAMPVKESRPGLTTPGDPGVAARDAAQAKGMAAIPEVGGYAPLMPAQQTVAVVGKGGMTSQFKVPKGSHIMSDPAARLGQTAVYDNDGALIGYSDGRVQQLRPSQADIQARQIAVQQERNAGKTGPVGGRGGVDRGLTGPQIEQQNFMARKKQAETDNPDATYTRIDWEREKRDRPDSITETTQPSRNQKTTTKKYIRLQKPGKPGSRDAALDTIGSYRGEMPVGTPSPAGQADLTPVGKTTDGRIIYKDAKGNTGTVD